MAVPVFFDPLKFCRKFWKIFFFDSDAGIFHLKMKHSHFTFPSIPNSQPDGSFMGILDRIGQNIHQYLADAYIIPIKRGRDFRVYLSFEPDIFIFRPL